MKRQNKMMKMKYLILWGLWWYIFPAAAQIQFTDGDLQTALGKAKAEKKMVFADFWAEWCGPCKTMAAEVFPDPEAGKYFNAHFVCVKINADAPENKEVIKKYGITSLPTMAFISPTGKEIRRVEGTVPADALIREARIATGEEPGFEQLYDRYRKNKKDFPAAQQLLFEAPGFMSTQKGIDREKWGARIDMLFPEYLKNKQLKNMINAEDFFILTLYHGRIEKNDPVFDFVVAHYDQYVQAAGKDVVDKYIIGLNNSAIIQMCKKGDQEGYRKQIQQMDGKLEKVYAGIKFGNLPVKEAITLLADGTYYLHKGDETHFFKKTDAYFEALGDSLAVSDILQPLEDLYRMNQGKLSAPQQQKAIVWLNLALQKEMDADTHTRLLVMLGDCYAGTGEGEKAKQSYNQAFQVTTRMSDPDLIVRMQNTIKHKLQAL